RTPWRPGTRRPRGGTGRSPAGRYLSRTAAGRCRRTTVYFPPALAEKVTGFGIKLNVRGGHVLFEVADRGRAGDQKHFWPQVQQPGQCHLGGSAAQAGGGGRNRRAGLDRVAAAGEAGAEREERHESDAAGVTLFQYRHGPPAGQVQQVLHAGDVGDGQRAAQVDRRDVAEADAADQAVLARCQHGGELVIEVLAGRGIVHQAQVDDGEAVDGQAAQVVLDSLPELGWPVVTEHTARCIPARADL